MRNIEAEYNEYPYKMYVSDGSLELQRKLNEYGINFKSNRYKLFQFKNEIDLNIAKLLK